MDAYTDITNTLSLTLGAAWASGINLYAAILMLGWLGMSGALDLPPDLQVLASPIVIAAAGLMYVVEFFADKVPGVDSGWDAIHTFIRLPAGALLAYGAASEVSPSLGLAAALVGGGVAAGTHATKAGTRVLINTSPEPFTNWFTSIGEDVSVIVGIWLALNHPYVFLALLVVFLLALVWVLPRIWKGIKKVFGFIAGLFGKKGAETPGEELVRPVPIADETEPGAER